MQPTAVLTPEGVESLITAEEAAALCGVSSRAVKNWANRGYVDKTGSRVRLPVAGRDRQGRNLYRQIDVAKAEYATRERARR